MWSWFSAYSQILITEYQTNNETTLQYKGDYPDWVEIHNSGNQSVNLEGFMISDKLDNPSKFLFTNVTIQPNQYLLVYLDSDLDPDQLFEADFGLKDGVDSLYLFDPYSNVLQTLFTRCVPEDRSYGLLPGDSIFDVLTYPTPGAVNSDSVLSLQLYNDTLQVNLSSGFYPSSIEVSLKPTVQTTAIFYSLNGDDADLNEEYYNAPFTLRSKVGEKDKIADEPTAPAWKEPKERVYKAQILRARGYYQGCPVTDEQFRTYFIDPNVNERYSSDIVSIISDRDNFFDEEEGIYVPGVNFDESNDGYSGNYFMKGGSWEREVHLEFFRPDGSSYLKRNAGARIHGNTSRSYPQKSIRIVNDAEYDADSVFHFPYFSDRTSDEYTTLILRTAGADISKTFFKDPLCHAIASELQVDYMSSRASVVFLNGEYWGIHNIRERQDEGYIEKYYGAKPGTYDLVSINNFTLDPFEVEEGTITAYNQLLNFVHTNQLNDRDEYDSLSQMIDMTNFIDYHILQLFVANEDWLNANTKFWRVQADTAKWRWLFFDCDRCFNDIDNERLKALTSNVVETTWANWATELQRAIFQNKVFIDLFSSRFHSLLSTSFSANNLLAKIESFEQEYAPLANEHIDRWRIPEAFYEWQDNVEALKIFAVYRPVEMKSQLQDVFESPFVLYPNPASDKIQVISKGSNTDFGLLHLEVFDLQGQPVYTIPNYLLGEQISTENWANGIYTLRLLNGEVFYTKKLVISR